MKSELKFFIDTFLWDTLYNSNNIFDPMEVRIIESTVVILKEWVKFLE